MKRMRSIRARLSENDSVRRFSDMGIDVFLGQAQFTGPDSLQVDDTVLKFSKAVIATGARAAHPPIPGLAEAGFLTNETVFSLTEKPSTMAIIGGGPIGCEMAQAFQRLGTQVILLHRNDHLLDREDPDAAEIIQKKFISEGIRVVLNADILGVERDQDSKIVHVSTGKNDHGIAVQEILVGVGRAPNIEGLNLAAAGVEYTRKGVQVNDRLQTSNPNIYAAGDICMDYKFTHAADAAARIVIQNALFLGRKKLSALTIPWCTYTDPEIAHVGLYEREARNRGIQVDTYITLLRDMDRAATDGIREGFVKVHVKKGTDTILGATIVAPHAGDMISELTFAIDAGKGLKFLAQIIHPYPTQAESIRKTADAYNRTRLTPFLKKLLKYWWAWNR
jgi:pyruvate/2-oxoglutarate dehydrogenase complex dihydrolipoamide dehydrogenase (E3) component